MSQLGKLLIFAGIVMVATGLILVFHSKIPWLGKLPGDIIIRNQNSTFYFPIVTCLIISILISLLFYVIRKLQ